MLYRKDNNADVLEGVETMTNFEMDTIQHQGEGHMSGRYYFGRGVLAFSLTFSILLQMKLWCCERQLREE